MLRRLIALVALVSAGCAPVLVYQQANPNPLKEQRTYVLLPLNFDSVFVGGQPEQDYLQSTPSMRQRWDQDKALAAREFADESSAQAKGLRIVAGSAVTPGAYVIQPLVANIEVLANDTATTMQVAVRIIDPSGKLVDGLTLSNAATVGGWGALARPLGANAAEYLLARTAGKSPVSTGL